MTTSDKAKSNEQDCLIDMIFGAVRIAQGAHSLKGKMELWARS